MRFLYDRLNFADVLQKLWNLVIKLSEYTSTLWNWLVSPVRLGMSDTNFQLPWPHEWNIPVLNIFFDDTNTFAGITFTPIEIIGGTALLALLMMFLLKTFVPLT